MFRWFVFLVFIAWGTLAQAQAPTACIPTRTVINLQGQQADIVVGATAVQVLDGNASACQRLLRNNGAADMRCLPVPQGSPTQTKGLLMKAGVAPAQGEQLLMGTEGRESWRCIAATATPTTATTIEGIP